MCNLCLYIVLHKDFKDIYISHIILYASKFCELYYILILYVSAYHDLTFIRSYVLIYCATLYNYASIL